MVIQSETDFVCASFMHTQAVNRGYWNLIWFFVRFSNLLSKQVPGETPITSEIEIVLPKNLTTDWTSFFEQYKPQWR